MQTMSRSLAAVEVLQCHCSPTPVALDVEQWLGKIIMSIPVFARLIIPPLMPSR